MLTPSSGASAFGTVPPATGLLRSTPGHDGPAGSPGSEAGARTDPLQVQNLSMPDGSRAQARQEDFGAASRPPDPQDDKSADNQALLPAGTAAPARPGMHLTEAQQACLHALGGLVRCGDYAALLARLAALDPRERQALLTASGQRQPLLHLLVERARGQEFTAVLEQFLDLCPAAADLLDREGCLALHRAASEAFMPALEVLARRTTDIDALDPRGQTALHRLCMAWLALSPRQLQAGIGCLVALRADWTIAVQGRDAACVCRRDVQARNLVMGLPGYTRSLLETLQANPRLSRADAERLLSAGLARTPLDLIDQQRRQAGAPALYQEDVSNLRDRRLCEDMLNRLRR